MIRLVIGYKKSALRPIYCGPSGADCQDAIDSAYESGKFDRIEQAEVPVFRRARRSQHLITPPIETKTAPGSSQAADAASRGNDETSLPPAPEQPDAGAEGSGGPSLV